MIKNPEEEPLERSLMLTGTPKPTQMMKELVPMLTLIKFKLDNNNKNKKNVMLPMKIMFMIQ